MSNIKWEDPPESTRGGSGGTHAAFFEALRKRPGEWAVFREDAPSSQVTQIRQGHLGGIEPGEFEATCRVFPGSSRGVVYARYVGGAK